MSLPSAEIRDRGVLLERQVRIALVEVEILVDAVGPREALFGVAELHRDELVDVAGVAVVMDRRRVGERPSSIVPTVGSASYWTSIRSRASNAASSSTAATAATGSPTKRTRSVHSACSSCETGRMPKGSEGRRPSRPRATPGRLERLRDVDRDDARVRELRAQQLAVQHPGQDDVVGETSLPRHLRRGVDLGVGSADDAGSSRAPAHDGTTGSSPRIRRNRNRTPILSSARRLRRASTPPRARPPRRS